MKFCKFHIYNKHKYLAVGWQFGHPTSQKKRDK